MGFHHGVDQPAPVAGGDHPAGHRAGSRSRQHPEPDLFHEDEGGMRRPLCGREDHQEHRDADPVVQPALDVQRLAYALGKPRVGDHRAAEPRVRRREDHAEDHRAAQ